MTQTTLESSAASQYASLVTLTWGEDPTVARYTHWDEPVSLGSEVFASEPSMDIRLPEQTGTVEERFATIEIDANKEPFAAMVRGFKHARVRVKIEQVDPNNADTRRALYFGWIAKVVKNPSGRSALVKAEVYGIKAQLLQIRMGIPATTECQWQFAGFGCNADRSSSTYSGTIVELGNPADNSIRVDLPGVGVPATDLRNTRFRRGQVIVDGLAVPIRASREDLRFDLFSLPPPEWLGKSCLVLPGCDKRLTTCRNEWSNEERYLGLGIAIPARNPLFEE